MASPYEGRPESQWSRITEQLVNDYPLELDDLVDAVLDAWDGILMSKIAGELQIGVDIFPGPQIMGNYLHELIPIMLERKFPGIWSRDRKRVIKTLFTCLTTIILQKSKHLLTQTIFMVMRVMDKKIVQMHHRSLRTVITLA